MGALESVSWWSAVVRWLRSVLSIESDRVELGAVDLRRHVVDAIKALAQYDRSGAQMLPASVALSITAPAADHAMVNRHLRDPSFDAEVKAALLNELYKLNRADLPPWSWSLVEGEGLVVTAVGAAARPVAWLEVRGGDHHGRIAPVVAGTRAFRMGRGERHGDDGDHFNDLQVSGSARFVSRRAAVLQRDGGRLMVQAVDQGDALIVRRADGERVIPARTVSQRAPIDIGDTLLFTDGGREQVEVLVRGEEPAAP